MARKPATRNGSTSDRGSSYPGVMSEPSPTRRCPACQHPLSAVRLAGIEVDGCDHCGGVWFDRGEIQQLGSWPAALEAIGQHFSGRTVPQTPAERCCPDCQRELEPFQFESLRGIELDRCPGCAGVWLDAGEAQEIADRLAGPPS
jgi:uncharacterized protein